MDFKKGFLNWIKNRSQFTILNLITASILIWLILPYFDNKLQSIWGYSANNKFYLYYLTVLKILVIFILMLIFLALSASNRTNKKIFITQVAVFIFLEIFLRLDGFKFAPVSIRAPISAPFIQEDLYAFPWPYIEFTNKPHADLSSQKFSILYEIDRDKSQLLNQIGLRGELPSKEKGGEFRIIILGGSAVFSNNSWLNSIPGSLGEILHQNGYTNVKVYNWGIVAFISSQELSLLTHLALDYKPDLVLVYDGANDVHQPFTYDPRPGYPYNWFLYETGLRLAKGKSSVEETLSSLFLHSKLLQQLFKKSFIVRLTQIESLRNTVHYNSFEWRKEIADNYLNNINKMCKISQGSNFKLAIFLQPLVFFKNPLISQEAQFPDSQEFDQHIKNTYSLMQNGFPRIQNPNTNCYFSDLSKSFENYNHEVFTDFVHLNQAGNKAIAEVIFRTLRNTNFLEIKN